MNVKNFTACIPDFAQNFYDPAVLVRVNLFD